MSFEAEVLLVRLRKHGSVLILPTLALGIAAFLASFLTGKFSEQWQNIVLYSVCGAIAFLGFVVPWLRWITAWTDITTTRVVQRSGLFGQNFRAVSMLSIESVELGARRVIQLNVSGGKSLEIQRVTNAKTVASEISRLAEKR
ncbi:MAG: hypothetical protein ACKORF_01815 [Micrococcales bacterium]